MIDEDAQPKWDAYYQRIRGRREREADALWQLMTEGGVTGDTVLAMDFVHFSNVRDNAESLAKQLSENYSIEVVPADEKNYWYIKGTTRPEGLYLSEEQHLGWVRFMADVARSYACVFSNWVLEAPALGKKFESESFDV